MTTLARSPESAPTQPDHVDTRGCTLRVALVVVALVAVGLGTAALFDRVDRSGSPTVPAAVDEVLDEFVSAMEASDHAQLQAVVTPGFRRTFYQGDADGSPWRDVWRLERYEFWNDPKSPSVDWQIERGSGPIVQGSGPWYVAESQIWTNAASGVQYEGVATFVVIETAGTFEIDDMYWAAHPVLLRTESIENANSDETKADFVDWLVARFISTGLDPPDASVIWLPPSLDCPKNGSFAQPADPRSDRRHRVTLCFDDPTLLLGGDVDGRWSQTATRYGLHEFAHVWMYIHLVDDTRAAFVERAGLDVWRGDRAWDELGVEHAAETIAWGVAGSDAAWYDIEPKPSCSELADRFELLTGLTPFTSCTTWSDR